MRQVRVIILKNGLELGGYRVMDKYELLIYWSAEDNFFIAEVPELPGCMAPVKKAIALWIDTAKEFGDPIPEPRGRFLVEA